MPLIRWWFLSSTTKIAAVHLFILPDGFVSLTTKFVYGFNAMITRINQTLCWQSKQEDGDEEKMNGVNQPHHFRIALSYNFIPPNVKDK